MKKYDLETYNKIENVVILDIIHYIVFNNNKLVSLICSSKQRSNELFQDIVDSMNYLGFQNLIKRVFDNNIILENDCSLSIIYDNPCLLLGLQVNKLYILEKNKFSDEFIYEFETSTYPMLSMNSVEIFEAWKEKIMKEVIYVTISIGIILSYKEKLCF